MLKINLEYKEYIDRSQKRGFAMVLASTCTLKVSAIEKWHAVWKRYGVGRWHSLLISACWWACEFLWSQRTINVCWWDWWIACTNDLSVGLLDVMILMHKIKVTMHPSSNNDTHLLSQTTCCCCCAHTYMYITKETTCRCHFTLYGGGMRIQVEYVGN